MGLCCGRQSKEIDASLDATSLTSRASAVNNRVLATHLLLEWGLCQLDKKWQPETNSKVLPVLAAKENAFTGLEELQVNISLSTYFP